MKIPILKILIIEVQDFNGYFSVINFFGLFSNPLLLLFNIYVYRNNEDNILNLLKVFKHKTFSKHSFTRENCFPKIFFLINIFNIFFIIQKEKTLISIVHDEKHSWIRCEMETLKLGVYLNILLIFRYLNYT